ncbi:MAG: hypothetical protein ABIZ80_04905 [Bryobacteraceae bacterium]
MRRNPNFAWYLAALCLLFCNAALAQPSLATLDAQHFAEFRQAFDSASDRVRVVAMFSPT